MASEVEILKLVATLQARDAGMADTLRNASNLFKQGAVDARSLEEAIEKLNRVETARANSATRNAAAGLRRQDRDEDWLAYDKRRADKRAVAEQVRNEDWVAKKDRLDRSAAERRQLRDEDSFARQESSDARRQKQKEDRIARDIDREIRQAKDKQDRIDRQNEAMRNRAVALTERNRERDIGLGTTVLGVAAGGAFAGLLYGAEEAISKFADLESAEWRLTHASAAFGHAAGFTGEQLLQMATDMAAGTPIMRQSMIEAEAILSRFTEIRGKQFTHALEAAKSMSYLTGKSVEDVASILGLALQNPERGAMTLQRSRMVRFSNLEIEEIKKRQESGDTQGAQELILKQIPKLAPPDTLNAEITRLKNSFIELEQEAGKALAPALREVIGALNAMLTSLKGLMPEQQQTIVGMLKMSLAMAGLVSGSIAAMYAIRGIHLAITALSANPILLLAAAAAAIIVAVHNAGVEIEEFQKRINDTKTGDPAVTAHLERIKDIDERKKKAEEMLFSMRTSQGNLLRDISRDEEAEANARSEMQSGSMRGPFVDAAALAAKRKRVEDIQRSIVSAQNVLDQANNPLVPPERSDLTTPSRPHFAALDKSWEIITAAILSEKDPVVDKLEEHKVAVVNALDNLGQTLMQNMPGGFGIPVVPARR